METPIKRKIFKLGGSSVITLPPGWRELIERETGGKLVEVAVEVDKILKIYPIVDGRILREE
ncbi:MAG: hypothetical protein FGF50_11170 [Candidatus Brockarchaeota archaeon]|nr:hypothetical protein [Candidatus Brockarchaeota archaeon]